MAGGPLWVSSCLLHSSLPSPESLNPVFLRTEQHRPPPCRGILRPERKGSSSARWECPGTGLVWPSEEGDRNSQRFWGAWIPGLDFSLFYLTLGLTVSVHFPTGLSNCREPLAADFRGSFDGTGSVSPCRQALFLSLLFILGKRRKRKRNASYFSEKTFLISGQGRFCGSCILRNLDPANVYSP